MTSLVKAANRLQKRIVAQRNLTALALRARGMVVAIRGVRPWAARAVSAVGRQHAATRMQAALHGLRARQALCAAKMAATMLQAHARGLSAKRAAEAAKNTAVLIEDNLKQIKDGTQLVTDTNDAFIR